MPDPSSRVEAPAPAGRAKAGPPGPAFRILGIDPGLASLGWGMIEARGGRILHLDHGCLSTKASLPIEERLATIYDFVAGLAAEWKPQAAALEGLFFWKNVTSAFPVAEAKGVIRLACHRSSVPLAEYTPTLIKQSVVGTSRAEKEQVQEMVRLLLGLEAVPKPDHAADALAAAICRWHHEGPLTRARG